MSCGGSFAWSFAGECSGQGRCVNGTCICNAGWSARGDFVTQSHGADCNYHTLTLTVLLCLWLGSAVLCALLTLNKLRTCVLAAMYSARSTAARAANSRHQDASSGQDNESGGCTPVLQALIRQDAFLMASTALFSSTCCIILLSLRIQSGDAHVIAHTPITTVFYILSGLSWYGGCCFFLWKWLKLSIDVTSPQAHTRLRHMMHAWWLSILLAACSFVCFGFTVGFPLYQRWLIGTYMALQGSAVAVLTGSAVFNGSKLLAALKSGLETLPSDVREQRKRNVARLQLYMKSCIVLGPTCASGFAACGVIPFFNANSGFYMNAVWLCGFFFLSVVTQLMQPSGDRDRHTTRVQPVTNVKVNITLASPHAPSRAVEPEREPTYPGPADGNTESSSAPAPGPAALPIVSPKAATSAWSS